jgi:hypothetical protein
MHISFWFWVWKGELEMRKRFLFFSADVSSWYVHFLLRLADTLVTAGETAAALSMIEAGQNEGTALHQDPRMKVAPYAHSSEVVLLC